MNPFGNEQKIGSFLEVQGDKGENLYAFFGVGVENLYSEMNVLTSLGYGWVWVAIFPSSLSACSCVCERQADGQTDRHV